MTQSTQTESGQSAVVEETARKVARTGKEAVERERSYAASTLDALSRALERAAESLSSDGHPRMADIMNRAAQEIGGVGGSIEQEDMGRLMNELRHFAHRSPAAFLGGAAVLGFGLTRFFEPKSEMPTGAGEAEAPEVGGRSIVDPVTHQGAPTGQAGVYAATPEEKGVIE